MNVRLDLLVLGLAATPALGQIHHTWTDIGQGIAAAGDVDRDGYDDILVGHAGQLGNVFESAVYSGRDGGLLLSMSAIVSNTVDYGWWASGPGDVDGDGYPDLIVAGPGVTGTLVEPVVVVFSGATGLELRRHGPEAGPFGGLGISSFGVGDVDGDGRNDYVLGALASLADDRTLLFSGATGSLLATFLDGGPHLAAAGDLDGDGLTDLFQASDDRKWFVARDLPQGNVLLRRTVAPAQIVGLVALGDVDGDGLADAAVALDSKEWLVLSGADGQTLHAGAFGGSGTLRLAAVGDQDEDGAGDFWISIWTGPGQLRSGATGALIETFKGYFRAGPAGDVNADDRPDFFAVEPKGGLDVVTVRSLALVRYCSPGAFNSTGGAAALSAVGSFVVGENNLELRAIGLPAAEPVVFLASPLARFAPGFGGGSAVLCVGSPTASVAASPLLSTSGGYASTRVRLDQLPPFGPVQPGDAVHFQAWYRDAAAGVPGTSDAVKIWFQ